MKKTFLILFFINSIVTSFSQLTRKEAIAKISPIYSSVLKNSALIYEADNSITSEKLIQNGLAPYTVIILRFEREGENEKLKTVEEYYYHSNRRLVSLYSNEENVEREDYKPFWLSDVASHTYGKVIKDNKGNYYTRQVWFNLE